MSDIDIQDTDPAQASERAITLVESLPWVRKYRDQVVVVKYGGNAMVSEELQDAFAADIAYLRYVGVKPVVVHGGGLGRDGAGASGHARLGGAGAGRDVARPGS